MKSPTLNLLPHEQEVSPATARKSFLVTSFLVTLIIVLLGGTGYLWLDLNTIAKEAELKELEQQDLKKAIGEADEVKLELAYILDRKESYEKLEAAAINYPKALEAIAEASPQNLRLINLALDANQISLTGLAADRSEAVTFTENLQKSKQFTAVSLSQANNQVDGVQFTVSMKFTPTKPATSPTPTKKAP